MKKMILTAVLGVALIGAHTQTAQAHDGRAVGAVLGGIVAGAIIADALQPHTTVYYSSPAPVYYSAPAPVCVQPQVVYAPAPVYCPPPAPVVYYREPVVRFGFGYVRGWGYRHHEEYGRGGYDHDRRW
jgi:hypothetical protein